MISELHIPVYHWKQYTLSKTDRIIIVDGCKGNSNVEDLIGREIAVIDHHKSTTTDDVPLADIRPEYGSCSTIISEYYREQKLIPSGEAASALLIGLARDTDLYTRGVTEMDLDALQHLFPYADHILVNDILRNNIQLSDLRYFHSVIEQIQFSKGIAFCYLPSGCPQNLMGILGDFILSLNEVHFVCLFALNSGIINISFRNNWPHQHASIIMKRFIKGMGRGGGHKEMAGGQLDSKVNPDPEKWYQRLLHLLSEEQKLPSPEY
jgi:nanoRNase/pAp phosphatase (c-di-AMP/oligoRNAs hydrolase)